MPVTTGGYDTATPADVTGSIDQAVGKFLAEARYTLQERPGVMKGSIRNEKLPEHQGPYVNIPKYGTVTTYALTQGIDMAQAQEITDTLMSIQPTEFGAQVILTDMLLMTVKDEFFRVAGRVLGDSFDRQQDQTLCDDLDNFSNALGSAGTALNLGHVMAAHAGIKYGTPAAGAGRGGEPGPDPVSGIFTPAQVHSLKKTLTGGIGAAGATQVVPDISRAAFSEEFPAAGVMIKSDVNLNKDASDDAKGGVLSKDAMILVTLGSGANAEKQRDASLRGWEVNFVGRWGRGEYSDAWGAEMLFDSVTPTS